MEKNYDNYAKTFSNSRINLKRGELDYFIDFLKGNNIEKPSVLDVGCGNGRLIDSFDSYAIGKYLGVDSSLVLLEEAKKLHSENDFLLKDMMGLDEIPVKFRVIFFIASFHHLETSSQRREVLKKAYDLLEDDGYILMTNWALNSDLNLEKYKKSIVENSENEFNGVDYSIKIGKYQRFYHCFSLDELKSLFEEQRFDIIDNRLFDNDKNYISIIKKAS